MSWDIIWSAIGITAGAIVMLVSILRFGMILETASYLRGKERADLVVFLKAQRALMVFFLLGYVVVLFGVIFRLPLVGNLLVGAIFFVGGLFVYMGLILQNRLVRGVLRQAEENLKRLEAERRATAADAANKAKSGFLWSMSHELRTPLNSILGSCEALREGIYGAMTPAQEQAMANIECSGQHQLQLVNDILDLSKIEAGRFEPSVVSFSLVDLCDEIAHMMRPQALQDGLRLFVSLDREVDMIESDPRRIRQMILNLLGNAVKFTPDGGRVGLELERTTDEVLVSVWDTGIGIAESNLERLFQPFTQLDSELNRQHAGTGLGLSLTAKLASALGGRVEVQSKVGKGSRFTLHLPVEVVTRAAATVPAPVDSTEGTVADARRLETPPPEVAASDAAPLPSQATGAHVLLVDDNPVNVLHVRDFLESKGHRVELAYSGEEALDLAKQRPEIIFMDVQMPGMDGIQTIERLRADANTRDLRIISLTSLAMGEDQERCMKAGADGYVSKPVSLRTLLELVEEGSKQGAPGKH
jgi:signal transduction histidine kinase/ActR/RegA family two-component response regulator